MVREISIGQVYDCPSGPYRVLQYNSSRDVYIEFTQTGYRRSVDAYAIRKGRKIVDLLSPTVLGKGYIGIGDYKPSRGGKHTRSYIVWRNMLVRVYSDEYQEKKPTYISCTLCREWHDFQVFSKWFHDNTRDSRKVFEIDKDILFKGNKHYSPMHCCLVPSEINVAFTKADSKRGIYLIGVSKCPKSESYIARFSKGGRPEYLGRFPTEKKAFLCYKKAKEEYIWHLANKYVGSIPITVYNALKSYEVEERD